MKIAGVEKLEEQAELCSEASFLTYHNDQREPGDEEWHQGHSKYNNQVKDTVLMAQFTLSNSLTCNLNIQYAELCQIYKS